MERVYKVVYRDRNGRLRSAMHCQGTVYPFWYRRSLVYGTDEFTVPKVGKIFAFATEHSAHNMAIDDHEVWLAETNGIFSEEVDWIPLLCADGNSIRRFWKTLTLDDPYWGMSAPYGTVICEDLRLIERVER